LAVGKAWGCWRSRSFLLCSTCILAPFRVGACMQAGRPEQQGSSARGIAQRLPVFGDRPVDQYINVCKACAGMQNVHMPRKESIGGRAGAGLCLSV
jgi:hypothetical protein